MRSYRQDETNVQTHDGMRCMPTFFCVWFVVSISSCHICRTNAAEKREGKRSPTLLAARNSKAATDFTSQMFWKLALFFFFCIFSFYLSCGLTDTSAEKRWILVTRKQWTTSITWWWPATRTGLCLTPSPSRELKNYSTLSLFPRCCQSMNTSLSCMINIPSTYHNSSESKMCLFVISCSDLCNETLG